MCWRHGCCGTGNLVSVGCETASTTHWGACVDKCCVRQGQLHGRECIYHPLGRMRGGLWSLPSNSVSIPTLSLCIHIFLCLCHPLSHPQFNLHLSQSTFSLATCFPFYISFFFWIWFSASISAQVYPTPSVLHLSSWPPPHLPPAQMFT